MNNENPWHPSALDAWDWDAFVLDANDLFARWSALIASEPPWTEMKADDVHGYMRSVISELVNEARDPRDGLCDQRLIIAAWEHGRFRRLQSCSSAAPAREFDALRLAVRAALRETFTFASAVADSLVVLEPRFLVACRAAALGWEGAEDQPFGASA